MQRSHLKIKKPIYKEINLYDSTTLNQNQTFSKEWIKHLELILHGKHSALFFVPESFKFLNLFKSLMQVKTKPNTFIGFNHLMNENQARNIIKDKSVYQIESGGVLFFKEFFKLDKKTRELFLNFKNSKPNNNDLIYLAQSSLCYCGKAKLNSVRNCKYSLKRCRSLIKTWTRKEIESFELILLINTDKRSDDFFDQLIYENIQERLKRAHEIQSKREQKKSNSELMVYELKNTISKEVLDFDFLPKDLSYKLLKNVVSVARSLADLDSSRWINLEHIEEAKKLSSFAIRRLERLI